MKRSSAHRFHGFERPDGRVGVRNHVLVLSILGLTNPTARRIATLVAGTICVTTPYGRGQYGPDAALHFRTLVGLASNPNVAAVLLVGADRKSVDAVADAVAASRKPVETVALDDHHEDALAMTLRGTVLAARLVKAASALRRTETALDRLFLAVECGHSDATSGLASNPLCGAVCDMVVDQGGTTVFGETVEWLGAESIVRARAADAAVGEAIVAAVHQREADIAARGVDLTGNNPGQENIRGGLSTIEEKSLGAISKGGTRPIAGLLHLSAPPARRGSHVMDAPSFAPESMTGFAAAGAQVILFTTGHGNSFCNLVAPTIKVSAHPRATATLTEQIDFDASPVLAGTQGIDDVARRLLDRVVAVSGGELTWGEILREGEEAFARIGTSL